jgi:hypothetical protein
MKTKRTKYCATRFTPEEKDRLFTAAALLGLNAAQLTRLAIREALPSLLRKLATAEPAEVRNAQE